MKHSSKSPIRSRGKVTSCQPGPRDQRKLAVSCTKPKIQSVNRQVYDCTAYQKARNNLLRLNNLASFLSAASNFVILTDQVVLKYQNRNLLTNISQKQIHEELGKALIKDGSFIVHYCKLLVKEQPQRASQIKQYFFESYRDKLSDRKGFFDVYFKEQIYTEKEETMSRMMSKSKKKLGRDEIQEISMKKQYISSKKKVFVSSFKNKPKQNDTFNESRSAIDIYQEETVTEVATWSVQKRKVIRSQEQEKKENNTDEGEQYDLPSFEHITSRKKKKETVDETSNTKSKSVRPIPGTEIVKFVDAAEGNQRLQQIYSSIKKEREEIQKKQSSYKKNEAQEILSPVCRSPYKELLEEMNKKKIHELNPEILRRITEIQRSLLNYFPNINKIALKKYTQYSSRKIIGKFEGKSVQKCSIMDEFQYGQPSYTAVYLSQTSISRACSIQHDLRKDDSVEVILVEDCQIPTQTYTTRQELTFGKM